MITHLFEIERERKKKQNHNNKITNNKQNKLENWRVVLKTVILSLSISLFTFYKHYLFQMIYSACLNLIYSITRPKNSNRISKTQLTNRYNFLFFSPSTIGIIIYDINNNINDVEKNVVAEKNTQHRIKDRGVKLDLRSILYAWWPVNKFYYK